ncbi:aldo/keto reductase [Ruminococcus sp. NK3A76]|uniref:aldo/keto reductase n=1 Tax=Ruminococcus sp. NK3A76 TaxID=877411 RepID=UPI00048B1D9E|nr:aldo/keto reductase [Ruminococcus sp. NK3A76]
MKKVKLKSGISVPAIGQGTWKIGDRADKREQEIQALRTGIEHGMTLIDTAEMYGDGRSESAVGEAITPYGREGLFIVSKVLPQNAGRRNMRRSCEESLKRLKTDYLDLYLYHWRGGIPLRETVECLQELKISGLIREWGVSNFNTADMQELEALSSGNNCTAVQDLYHIGSRGTEYSLKPYLKGRGIAFMAYCPLAINGSLRRGITDNAVLRQIASAHSATVQQIMLAWAVRDGNTIAIPKSSSQQHTTENAQAADIQLTEDELTMLDKEFPAPDREVALDVE